MKVLFRHRVHSGREAFPRPGGAAGFTLVELLISVAIVGVLLAVLATSLPKFREKSESVRCMGNLKTIFQGLSGYLNDHEGIYPPAQLPEPLTLWYHVIQPYVDGTERSVESVEHPGWLNCPGKHFTSRDRLAVGYGWNYVGFGDVISDPVAKARIVSVDRPSETILAGDSPDVGVAREWWQNVYIYGERDLMAKRHAGTGNYLFVDGHIEAFTPEKLAEKSPGIFQSRKAN